MDISAAHKRVSGPEETSGYIPRTTLGRAGRGNIHIQCFPPRNHPGETRRPGGTPSQAGPGVDPETRRVRVESGSNSTRIRVWIPGWILGWILRIWPPPNQTTRKMEQPRGGPGGSSGGCPGRYPRRKSGGFLGGSPRGAWGDLLVYLSIDSPGYPPGYPWGVLKWRWWWCIDPELLSPISMHHHHPRTPRGSPW